MRAALLLALLLAPVTASAVTWYVERPTTGSPCASFEWEAYETSGFRFLHVLTEDSLVAIEQGDWPSRVRCRCWDDADPRRIGPWSPISATYVPRGLMQTWWDAGERVGMAGLTMVVAFTYSVEAAWPDSLR